MEIPPDRYQLLLDGLGIKLFYWFERKDYTNFIRAGGTKRLWEQASETIQEKRYYYGPDPEPEPKTIPHQVPITAF
jgi:hypothetical protein